MNKLQPRPAGPDTHPQTAQRCPDQSDSPNLFPVPHWCWMNHGNLPLPSFHLQNKNMRLVSPSHLSYYLPSSTVCQQGMRLAVGAFSPSEACGDDPWDDACKVPHVLRREALYRGNTRDRRYHSASVERPQALGVVPPPSLETAAARPCVRSQPQTFRCPWRQPCAAAGAACSSAQAVMGRDTDEGWCPHLGAISQCSCIQQTFTVSTLSQAWSWTLLGYKGLQRKSTGYWVSARPNSSSWILLQIRKPVFSNICGVTELLNGGTQTWFNVWSILNMMLSPVRYSASGT